MTLDVRISRPHRTVIIIAGGEVTPDDVRAGAWQLAQPQLPSFSKFVDLSRAGSEAGRQAEPIAKMLAEETTRSTSLGPVAVLVEHPVQVAGAALAELARTRPVRLFNGILEAREWLRALQGKI
jgi:hypothetical protein